MADDLGINRAGLDPSLLQGQDIAAGNESDTFLKKISRCPLAAFRPFGLGEAFSRWCEVPKRLPSC